MSSISTRRRFLKNAALLAAGGSTWAYVTCGWRKDFDVVIRGGTVLDGTGREGYAGDVGIKKGRITALGNLTDKSARRVIDAAGLVVAPGFIDFHSHSDDDLLIDPRAQSKIRQGVTTEVVGQDGDSVAPLSEPVRAEMDARWRHEFGISVDWTDFAGYFRRLEKRKIAVNVISMVGQGILRAFVIGEDNRPASSDDIAAMQTLARQALQQGAFGISSGLEYTPGSFASTDEIIELCRAMSHRGIYSTHMRNEDDHVLEAIDEAVRIAATSGVALNISHIKAEGKRNWGKVGEIFKRLDAARDAGMQVTCDRYPYIAYNTGLDSLFPLWSREGGREQFVARLQNPVLRDSLRAGVMGKIDRLGSWDAVMISRLDKEQHKNLEGQTLGTLTQATRREPFDFLLELLIAEEGRGEMVGFGMSEAETSAVLAYPHCMIASDASALAADGPLGRGNPHPRAYGSFPRVLAKYVRAERLLALPEAIRKMTALPASTLGLADRGSLKPGYWADVVIFDPDRVQDRATWDDPHQYPEGIPYVLVNGEVVVDNAEHTGALPGKVLRAPFDV